MSRRECDIATSLRGAKVFFQENEPFTKSKIVDSVYLQRVTRTSRFSRTLNALAISAGRMPLDVRRGWLRVDMLRVLASVARPTPHGLPVNVLREYVERCESDREVVDLFDRAIASCEVGYEEAA